MQRDSRGRFVKRRSSVPTVLYTEPPPAPTFKSEWRLWCWLLITAVLLYAAGPALLVIAAIVGFMVLWVKFAQKYPLVAIALLGFFQGLLGGRRR